MKELILDTIGDLRSRRLWPVAVALLAAVIAAPVLLLKPAAEQPAEPPAAAQPRTGSTALPAVQMAQDAAGSDLGVYDETDPFRPKVQAKSKGTKDGVATAPGDDGKGGSAGEAKSEGGGATSGDTKSEDSGSGTGSGDSPRVAPDAGGEKSEPKFYSFEVDVRFGRIGAERTYKGLSRLEMLPNERRPLLVYLGVTKGAKTAVFLVDTSLGGQGQQGEGSCKPSRSSCSFLYLRTANGEDEHYFTDANGYEYRVQLIDIDRVEEGAKSKGSRKVRGAGRSFSIPLLADVTSR